MRDVAAVLYYGGNPADHEETAELWQKWHFLFEMFEFCKHSKYASLTQLPAAGGIFDHGLLTECNFYNAAEGHKELKVCEIEFEFETEI